MFFSNWCPLPESNQRHGDFQSPALPTELSGQVVGAGGGNRTPNLLITNQLLYR